MDFSPSCTVLHFAKEGLSTFPGRYYRVCAFRVDQDEVRITVDYFHNEIIIPIDNIQMLVFVPTGSSYEVT